MTGWGRVRRSSMKQPKVETIKISEIDTGRLKLNTEPVTKGMPRDRGPLETFINIVYFLVAFCFNAALPPLVFLFLWGR